MKKARIIRVDGTEQEITPENGTDFKLAEMYKIVGTDDPIIQIVPLDNDEILVCHDNGIAMGLQPNEKATERCKGLVYMAPQGIVGDVLICHDSMVQ